MNGSVRVDGSVRVAPSGWKNAKSGGFAGSVRVVSADRVPKNSWAEKTPTYAFLPYGCACIQRVIFPQTFSDPDHPDHPDGGSVYAGFRKLLTLTETLFTLTTLTEIPKTTTFMGKTLR